MSFRIKMKKDDFFKIHNRIKSKNLVFENDMAEFSIDRNSLKLLKKTSYDYSFENTLNKRIITILKKYYLLIIGVMFTFTIIYVNSYRVTTIVFSKDTPINNEIENKIKEDYRHLWWFNFYTKKLNELENSIKKQYIEYPFLEIAKTGDTIYVSIDGNNEDNIVPFSLPGTIISKSDGIIAEAICYSGNLVVEKNRYVNKGDVLIENIGEGVSGEIMAYTYSKVNVAVAKKTKEYELSNTTDEYYGISIFNKDFYFGQKKSFVNSIKKEEMSFNIFDAFSLKKIVETEKNAIIKEIRTLNDAISFAKQKFTDYFNERRTNYKEKIVEIEYYSSKEEQDEYIVSFVVKALESIGELKTV